MSAAYMATRRALAVSRGDCMVCCKRPKQPGRVRCKPCDDVQSRLNRAASRSSQAIYIPLDEIEIRPRVRLLRKLRWLDWTTTLTVLDALEVDPSERNKYGAALTYAVKSGCVECRTTGGTREYRITEAGRAELRRIAVNYERNLGEGVAA